MRLPFVISTRLLFWAQGFCPCPWVIFVRPERKGDAALLAHEKVHIEQMRRVGLIRFWLAYLFDDAFRFDSELEAYRRQLELDPGGLYRFANGLATIYWLDITYEEALLALVEA